MPLTGNAAWFLFCRHETVYPRVCGGAGEAQKAVLRRRYIVRFEVEGEDVPALVVFERDAQTWSGTTAFSARRDAYLLMQRVGKRIYRRAE